MKGQAWQEKGRGISGKALLSMVLRNTGSVSLGGEHPFIRGYTQGQMMVLSLFLSFYHALTVCEGRVCRLKE
jgi:hypothetical protein